MNDIVSFDFDYYKNTGIGLSFKGKTVLSFIVILSIYNIYFHFGHVTILVGLFLVWFYILTFKVKLIYRIIFWYKFKKKIHEDVIGEIMIELNELNVNARSTRTEGTCSWKDFKLYVESKDYFFLYHNSKSGLIIPKRIFLLPQEEYDVKSFIERKLAEQKSNHE